MAADGSLVLTKRGGDQLVGLKSCNPRGLKLPISLSFIGSWIAFIFWTELITTTI